MLRSVSRSIVPIARYNAIRNYSNVRQEIAEEVKKREYDEIIELFKKTGESTCEKANLSYETIDKLEKGGLSVSRRGTIPLIGGICLTGLGYKFGSPEIFMGGCACLGLSWADWNIYTVKR